MTASVPHFHDNPEPALDHPRIADDTCQLWRRHAVVPAREDIVAHVSIVVTTYYDDAGVEWRRTRSLLPPGLEKGQLIELLTAELKELSASRPSRS
jgi:hypothetical protein